MNSVPHAQSMKAIESISFCNTMSTRAGLVPFKGGVLLLLALVADWTAATRRQVHQLAAHPAVRLGRLGQVALLPVPPHLSDPRGLPLLALHRITAIIEGNGAGAGRVFPEPLHS